jgi:hypothetical protein
VNKQIEDYPITLKLKPRLLSTKERCDTLKQNPLVQVNTRSTKPMKVVFEYLASKFKVDSAVLIDIHTESEGCKTYNLEKHGSKLLGEVFP